MTRYDPFAYGQVKLGAGQDAPAADPDDMLFADAEQMQQTAQADSSWALLKEDVGALLPGSSPEAFAAAAAEFGDILGEHTGAPAAKAQPKSEPAARPRPRSAPPASRGGPVPTTQAATPAAAVRSEAPVRAIPATPAPAARAAAPRRPMPLPGGQRGSRGAIAVVVPFGICVAGGCGGAWLCVMQQNPILGGIVVLSSCVAGLFAWMMLRA